MAASNGRKSSSANKSSYRKTAKGSAGTSARKRKEAEARAARDRALFHEIGLIALFAVMVFLFCCNFGIIGPGGDTVSGVLFGVFGLSAYVLPVLLFLAVAFWFANEGSPNAVRKLIAGVVLFLMLGIVCDLVSKGAAGMEKYEIGLLYEECRIGKKGGGVLGGSISFFLQSYLETIGTVLVVLLGSVVSLILLTEKSLLSGVKRGGSHIREISREETARRREAAESRRQQHAENEERRRVRQQAQEEQRAKKAEERRLKAEARENEKILRMERKVSGVMIDTALTRPEHMTQHRDDMHEIILEEEIEEGLPKTMEEGSSIEEGRSALVASGQEDIEAAMEKIPVHSMGSVSWEGAGEQASLSEEEGGEGTADFWGEEAAEDAPRPIVVHRKESERISATGVVPGQDDIRGSRERAVPESAVRVRSVMEQTVYRDIEPAAKTDGTYPEAEITGGVTGTAPGTIEGDRTQMSHGRNDWGDPERRSQAEENVETGSRFAGEENVAGGRFAGEENVAGGRFAGEENVAGGRFAGEESGAGGRFAGEETGAGGRLAAEQTGAEDRFVVDGAGIGDRGADRLKAASPAGGSVANASGLRVQAETGIPKKYSFPPLSLLKKGVEATGDSARELRETAMHLQQTLSTFGVKVTITDISQGPSVTRYELQPEQGVKVSKIVGLTDDIKLNLAAMDIRIEAPIPGKAAIGIEVPNKETIPVGLREILESREFTEHKSKIAFAVGKDIAGKVVVEDIARMPHMLIAGATGSGKSVCINTLIMSILYKADPNDVKLILVDPKVVELSIYNGIPHLLIPVVTDPKKASAALHWAVSEMESRYAKFAEYGVRKLEEYNKKVEMRRKKGETGVPPQLPQIVIIVDELADLMMVCPGEVEGHICRLAQLARACGIHLIIATQRPSVDVITGLIKANMPSRVAFAVSSGVDSRTILDMVGAEKLLGRGDMLFAPQGYPKPARVQGAFVSDQEVADVVDFLKNQALGNTYAAEIEEKIASLGSGTGGGEKSSGGSVVDELFEKAGRLIIDKDKASIGMLQRALQIGFNRAARIMDQLCQYGVVGEEEGTKPRKILMSPEQFEQLLEEVA